MMMGFQRTIKRFNIKMFPNSQIKIGISLIQSLFAKSANTIPISLESGVCEICCSQFCSGSVKVSSNCKDCLNLSISSIFANQKNSNFQNGDAMPSRLVYLVVELKCLIHFRLKCGRNFNRILAVIIFCIIKNSVFFTRTFSETMLAAMTLFN